MQNGRSRVLRDDVREPGLCAPFWGARCASGFGADTLTAKRCGLPTTNDYGLAPIQAMISEMVATDPIVESRIARALIAASR